VAAPNSDRRVDQSTCPYASIAAGECPDEVVEVQEIRGEPLTGSFIGGQFKLPPLTLSAVRQMRFGTLAEARAAGFRHPNCRCSWIPFVNGADLAEAAMFAEPIDLAEETYRASQVQRALERRVRLAGHTQRLR
jgi:Phage minor capsid protein 2